LRKYLGYLATDLAAIMGVAPETVSRWESTKNPQAIGAPAERLLRLMAIRDQPVEDYPSERMADIGVGATETTLRFEADESGWHKAA
jgi:transcriptional regulator with XRE-family HTH domain